ncbi:MAG: VanZ family protein [Planctomycetaceae bacterium]|jgi:VanZ family protein|nr:VanZ family protein [Planctomycetaceae bacterium]
MLRCLHRFSWFYFTVLTLLLLSPDFTEPLRRGIKAEGYAHILVFGLLGLLFEAGRRKRTFEFWAAFLTLYAVGTEILQGALNPVCYRECDLNDMIQDLAGVQAGMVIARLCVLTAQWKTQRKTDV